MAAETPSSELKDEDVSRLEIVRRVAEAFDVFDHESNKTVDVRWAPQE